MRAEIAVRRVLHRQAIEHLTVARTAETHRRRESRVDVRRAVAEIRFAQPSVDAAADLDADDCRARVGAAMARGEKHLAETALAEQTLDAVLQPALGARDQLLRDEQVL